MGRFHAGETEVQTRLGVREGAARVGRIIAAQVPPAARSILARQRLALAASLDERSRPWASLLTGQPGFVAAADHSLLRIAAASLDETLAANLESRPELGLLVIDLATRQRMRFNGRGLISPDGLFLLADEVYGNCPKYIQTRRLVRESGEKAGEVRRSSALHAGQRAMIRGADTLFIATWHAGGGADLSHRGGRPGFVNVEDEKTLSFPDYPGNNMFNTLGNLVGYAWAGLLFVDFERGDLLQLTGRAQVVWGPQTALRVDVEEVRESPGGSPLRFELVEPWPANPSLAVTVRGRRHLKDGRTR